MPPWDKYATKPSASPDVPDVPSTLKGGNDAVSMITETAGNYWDDYNDRVHQAADQLLKDVNDPMVSQMGVLGSAKVGSDALNYVLSPATAALDWTDGRFAHAMSGGRIPTQTAGDIAGMVIPGVGEVLSESRLAKAAEEAGVSVESLRANLAQRAKLDTANKTRESAAKRLVVGGGLGKPGAVTEMRDLASEHENTRAGRPPVLLDVLPLRAQRVVRAAGGKIGEGDVLLEKHRQQTRLGVAEEATQRTEELSPAQESVAKRRKNLVERRDNLARTQYRKPYAHPIQTDDRLFEVLNSPQTMTAITRARGVARERMLDDPSAALQYHELKALGDYFTQRAAYEGDLAEWEASGKGSYEQQPNRDAQQLLDDPGTAENIKAGIRKTLGFHPSDPPQPPPMPVVSGGALDRIRINLRNRADSLDLGSSKQHDLASALRGRQKALDDYLDTVPHLKEARATYHDYSKRIEQMDFERNLSTMRPNEFREYLSDLSDGQRSELIHNISEKMARQFGTSARAAAGREDVMTTGPNMHKNLEALLGKESADRYMRAIDLIGQKLDKANYASSRTGSQTALRSQDLKEAGVKAGLWMVMGHPHRAIYEITRFVEGNFLFPEEEAQQIAQWAVQQKDVESTLQEIGDALTPAGRKASKLPGEILSMMAAGTAAAGATHGIEQTRANPTTPDTNAPLDLPPLQTPSGDGPWSKYKGAPGGNDGDAPKEPAAFTSNADVSNLLQTHLGVPVRITSGFRDPTHNAEVGGAAGSAHTKGEAWDFVPQGMSMREAADKLKASGLPFDQIEVAKDHVHVSFGPRNRGQIIGEGAGRAQGSAPQSESDDYSAFAPADAN